MAENNELNDDELVDYDDEGDALEGVGNVAAAGGDVKKCVLAARARARAGRMLALGRARLPAAKRLPPGLCARAARGAGQRSHSSPSLPAASRARPL
jgi:hypothetical protein